MACSLVRRRRRHCSNASSKRRTKTSHSLVVRRIAASRNKRRTWRTSDALPTPRDFDLVPDSKVGQAHRIARPTEPCVRIDGHDPAEEADLDLGLKDKVAIVTGGSRGIGKACAKELLAEGACVVLVSKDPAINAAAVRELGKPHPDRVLGVPTDVVRRRLLQRA